MGVAVALAVLLVVLESASAVVFEKDSSTLGALDAWFVSLEARLLIGDGNRATFWASDGVKVRLGVLIGDDASGFIRCCPETGSWPRKMFQLWYTYRTFPLDLLCTLDEKAS